MKYTAHIPVEQYGFISVETDSAEDAIHEYRSIKRLFAGGAGNGMKAFATIVAEYCTTGGIINGGDIEFSENEQLLLAELKKIMRKDKGLVRDRD